MASDAIERLMQLCHDRDLNWSLYEDRDRVLKKCVARVHEPHGRERLRIIERGTTPWEAAAKAADLLERTARA